MTLEVIVTKDYEHMSDIPTEILVPKFTRDRTFDLGLSTGRSSLGLRQRIVKRQREFDASKVRVHNPDEFIGLLGGTPPERMSLHWSYYREMYDTFYKLFDPPLKEINSL